MNKINSLYERNGYKVFKSDDCYIVQNCNIDGFVHSHIKNYKTCLWIIDLSIKKKCPFDLPKYLVISLIRLTNDEKYLQKLNGILDKKNRKKEHYFNSNKGVR